MAFPAEDIPVRGFMDDPNITWRHGAKPDYTEVQGRIQDLITGGPQIMTGLKLPFWGLSFVEFWCWGLIFGGQGGARAPRAPPGSAPGGSYYSHHQAFLNQ